MSRETCSRTENDSSVSINSLPDEVLEYILSLVPAYKDLQDCRLVCKRWYKNVQNVIYHKKIDFHRAICSFSVQWENLYPTTEHNAITKRYSHSACSYGNAMYVFGGCTCTSTTFNDLWMLDLSTRKWCRLLTMGSYPSPKACASLVYYNSSLVLFGGWTHPSPYPLHQAWRTFNELHIYDIESNRWNCITNPTNAPPPMAGHSATVHGDSMIVFGGLQGHNGGSNDVWCLNMKTHTWIKKETNIEKPHSRYGQSQIYVDDNHLIILGGWGGPPNMVMADVWLLSMIGRIWTWKQVEVQNTQWAASHLWCHPACRVDDYVVVLSRNPVSTPSPLAYSKWTSNTVGPNHQRMLNNSEARGLALLPPEVDAGPSFDRDVNINGRRGSLISRVMGEIATVHRTEYLSIRAAAYGQNLYTSLLAFREEPQQGRHRERQLEALRRMEEKLRSQQQEAIRRPQPHKGSQTPKMAMFVLNIAEVLGPHCRVSWMPVKAVPNGSPETTILYTLVRGNGELVMFGGIKKDATSITQQNPQTMDISDTVSNSLHFITAPRGII
ncbi:hypothetical protein AAG570_001010 [Ranatra chinensis]|uniref:F-box domain-containing protein n=1 Tax=Ranatra chinensis TaxID=642074 RepID=A0ABD0YAL3_9HEMI